MADPRNSLQKQGKPAGKQMDGMAKATLIVSLITIVLSLGLILYLNVAFG